MNISRAATASLLVGTSMLVLAGPAHEDYHGTGDTADKLMFGKMEKIARLVFHTSWELANREKRIVVDKKVEGR